MLWTRCSPVAVFRDFPYGLLQIIITVMLLGRNLKKIMMMLVMLLLRLQVLLLLMVVVICGMVRLISDLLRPTMTRGLCGGRGIP